MPAGVSELSRRRFFPASSRRPHPEGPIRARDLSTRTIRDFLTENRSVVPNADENGAPFSI